jgi:peptide methionine sulfoxide reductase MsrB
MPCIKTVEGTSGNMLIQQFRVLREKGTERPGSSKLDHTFNEGVYSMSDFPCAPPLCRCADQCSLCRM